MSFNVEKWLAQEEIDPIVRKTKERMELKFMEESMSTLCDRLEWSRSRLHMTEDAIERYIEKKIRSKMD